MFLIFHRFFRSSKTIVHQLIINNLDINFSSYNYNTVAKLKHLHLEYLLPPSTIKLSTAEMSSLTSVQPSVSRTVLASESGDKLGDLVDKLDKVKVNGNEDEASIGAPEKYIKHPLQVFVLFCPMTKL